MNHLMLFENYIGYKLLLLDLDNTLVYVSDPAWADEGYPSYKIPGGLVVQKRPHLNEFLDYCFKNFRVGICTARKKGFASSILKGFKRPLADYDTIVTGEKMEVVYTSYTPYHVKDLTKLRVSLERVVLIDDKPEGCAKTPDNLLPVKPYYGGAADDELLRLMAYLEHLKTVEDVRQAGMSGWATPSAD